jgi:hypothetical protein
MTVSPGESKMIKSGSQQLGVCNVPYLTALQCVSINPAAADVRGNFSSAEFGEND